MIDFNSLRPKRRSSFVCLPDKDRALSLNFQPCFSVMQLAKRSAESPVFSQLNLDQLCVAWEKTLDYYYGSRFTAVSVTSPSSKLSTTSGDSASITSSFTPTSSSSTSNDASNGDDSSSSSVCRLYRFKQHTLSRPYYVLIQFMELKSGDEGENDSDDRDVIEYDDNNHRERRQQQQQRKRTSGVTMALYIHSQYRLRNHSNRVNEFGHRLLRQLKHEVRDSYPRKTWRQRRRNATGDAGDETVVEQSGASGDGDVNVNVSVNVVTRESNVILVRTPSFHDKDEEESEEQEVNVPGSHHSHNSSPSENEEEESYDDSEDDE